LSPDGRRCAIGLAAIAAITGQPSVVPVVLGGHPDSEGPSWASVCDPTRVAAGYDRPGEETEPYLTEAPRAVDWSTDGRRILGTGTHRALVFDVDTETLSTIDIGAVFSPDGLAIPEPYAEGRLAAAGDGQPVHHDRPGRVQVGLHPLDARGRLLAGRVQRLADLLTVELTGRCRTADNEAPMVDALIELTGDEDDAVRDALFGLREREADSARRSATPPMTAWAAVAGTSTAPASTASPISKRFSRIDMFQTPVLRPRSHPGRRRDPRPARPKRPSGHAPIGWSPPSTGSTRTTRTRGWQTRRSGFGYDADPP
jgi:hypothetical protein